MVVVCSGCGLIVAARAATPARSLALSRSVGSGSNSPAACVASGVGKKEASRSSGESRRSVSDASVGACDDDDDEEAAVEVIASLSAQSNSDSSG